MPFGGGSSFNGYRPVPVDTGAARSRRRDVVSCRLLREPGLDPFDKRLAALTPEVLGALLRGIEKEGLRVRPDGMLSDTPHPPGLGSALTHPRITIPSAICT